MLFVQDFSGLDTTLVEFSDHTNDSVFQEKVTFPTFPDFHLISENSENAFQHFWKSGQ